MFSVENTSRLDEYIKEEEVIFITDVMKIESKISGTKQAMLYGHKEGTYEELVDYVSKNTLGVNNALENKGFGYDKIATYNHSS